MTPAPAANGHPPVPPGAAARPLDAAGITEVTDADLLQLIGQQHVQILVLRARLAEALAALRDQRHAPAPARPEGSSA
jgi:hypothetical protein